MHPADTLFYIFFVSLVMTFVWQLEVVFRIDKRWLPYIMIFPPIIIIFILNNFAESKSPIFYFCLLFAIATIISPLIGFPVYSSLLANIQIAAFWPYYLYLFFLRF